MRQAGIFAKVSGNLEETYVEMGTAVRQGQRLALIDTTELYLQYQEAAATCQNAGLAFDRAQELYNRSLGSKQDQDNAEAAFKIAQANRDLAAMKLGYARITAPFSGIITRRFLDPGALVTASSSTLFTLMDLDSVKVILNILEKDIPRVAQGKSAAIVADAFPDRKFWGRVTRFSEAVDRSTRTMAVEIDIPNPERLLRPGMFASITLIVEEHENALTVPTPAVLKDGQGNYLYMVSADTARKTRVTTGIEQDSLIEILSGIADTTIQVITTGQQFVKDGGPVILQP